MLLSIVVTGVNLLFAVTQQVARALGEDFDIEIVEMHHRHKIDAPSGTALGLGEAAAAGRGVDFDAVKQLSREGITGERKPGDIGFAAAYLASEHASFMTGQIMVIDGGVTA